VEGREKEGQGGRGWDGWDKEMGMGGRRDRERSRVHMVSACRNKTERVRARMKKQRRV
jgi:hypothetical protein